MIVQDRINRTSARPAERRSDGTDTAALRRIDSSNTAAPKNFYTLKVKCRINDEGNSGNLLLSIRKLLNCAISLKM